MSTDGATPELGVSAHATVGAPAGALVGITPISDARASCCQGPTLFENVLQARTVLRALPARTRP